MAAKGRPDGNVSKNDGDNVIECIKVGVIVMPHLATLIGRKHK